MKTTLKIFYNFIFVFGLFIMSFSFVFADSSCECKIVGTSPSYSVAPQCLIEGNISENKCIIVASGSFPSASGSCICKPRETTGGLVPCINDCTAEDLLGNATNGEAPVWTSLLRTALGISGIFILMMFIYGGVRLIISKGDKGKVKTATDIMKNSVYGLLVVIFAYTFVKYVVMAIVGSKWNIFFGA